MSLKRVFAVSMAVGTIALGGVSAAVPANAVEGGIDEVPQESLPAFPGLVPTYDTVTVVDAATGEVIGAEPYRQARAVSIIGPGCTPTSMCLYSSPYRGYQGTGSLTVSVSGVGSYTNGTNVGQLQWKSGSNTVTGPKTTGPVSISGGSVTVVKVTIF
jgi:hypothetical protein